MSFSQKAKKYFKEEMGLNNRKLSEVLDGYSEVLISNHFKSDEISGAFIKRLLKYIPNIDIEYLLKDSIPVRDYDGKHNIISSNENEQLINEIEERLLVLKRNITRV
jgi:hypothetical protein